SSPPWSATPPRSARVATSPATPSGCWRASTGSRRRRGREMAPSIRLLLLRHGQTHANVAGALDTGEPGLDLTDLGRAQAAAAARALVDSRVEGVFVSRLVRTQ